MCVWVCVMLCVWPLKLIEGLLAAWQGLKWAFWGKCEVACSERNREKEREDKCSSLSHYLFPPVTHSICCRCGKEIWFSCYLLKFYFHFILQFSHRIASIDNVQSAPSSLPLPLFSLSLYHPIRCSSSSAVGNASLAAAAGAINVGNALSNAFYFLFTLPPTATATATATSSPESSSSRSLPYAYITRCPHPFTFSLSLSLCLPNLCPTSRLTLIACKW